MIANGYIRLDPQEWVRAVEKRGRRSVGNEWWSVCGPRRTSTEID
jgi:hypothetical protein